MTRVAPWARPSVASRTASPKGFEVVDYQASGDLPGNGKGQERADPDYRCQRMMEAVM